ncbi:hypothetical protein TELCIR_21529, partial [Teladorsagia circumcincta]
SNLAVALICMTSCPHHGYGGDLKWKTEQKNRGCSLQGRKLFPPFLFASGNMKLFAAETPDKV